jgi:hypothetical protein
MNPQMIARLAGSRTIKARITAIHPNIDMGTSVLKMSALLFPPYENRNAEGTPSLC